MHMMKDMELEDEEVLDCPAPADCERAKYPYGLRISLTEKELEKLDIDPDEAFVGGICHLHALAKITSVSKNETQDADGDPHENCRIELQICAMAVESEDEENDEYEPKMSGLYDGM